MNEFIIQAITDFVGSYKDERRAETTWGRPLVRFADARDPLFSQLKRAVGPTHARPEDLLEGARTVVAYFLPFDKAIAKSNRREYHASRQWAVAYVETNRLIMDLNAHLAGLLEEKDHRAAVLPPTHNFDEKSLVSDWSHKHAAYIAGLGRFGFHTLLITDKGCCGRFGSFVTTAPAEPSPRPETERCLHAYNGTCRVCVKKCVTGALKTDSFDRHRCYRMLLENMDLYEKEGVADVCGKCTAVVPCSFQNPVEKARRAGRGA